MLRAASIFCFFAFSADYFRALFLRRRQRSFVFLRPLVA
jgi:hypothetical protein